MNKKTTIEDFIEYIIKNTCSKCKFYNSNMRVCGGEVLPVERAILRNIEDRGCCSDVKQFIESLRKIGENNEID